MKKILLGIFMAVGGVIFLSQNTFADWVQQSSIYFDSRTYGINEGSGWNMTTDTNFGMRSLPVTILNTMNGQGRRLLNFTVYQPITDNTNNRFKSIQMDITVQQDTSFNYDSINDVGGGITVITSNGNVYGTCGISASGRNYKQFRCQANMPEYTTVTGVYMRVGEAVTANDIPIASIASSSTNNVVPFQPIKVTYIAYDFKSSPDPSLGLLQQQINQNQTIINQNQQIINAQNETNEWLQDTTPPSVDTSSLNSSVGWMPAGPVDSILTLPLQLLQGIVNVFTNTNCTPLQVPVPYVDKDIILPCVSTLMDDIGFTPVWNIVGGVISAVIIWGTLKWLYKFVDDTLTFRENNAGMWGGL